jgi:hypothetical protein
MRSSMNSMKPAPARQRRGFAAVLAMLYLTLFSVLALGLYSAATVSTQLSYNDSHNMRSLMAAENGLHFIRYQLDTLDIPYTNLSDSTAMFNTTVTQLHTKLDNTSNMQELGSGAYYNPTTGVNAAGNNVMYIPGRTGSAASPVQHWMPMDATSSCYIMLEQAGTNLKVTVVGRYGDANVNPDRAVQLTFNPAPNNADIFSYGLASKSAVSMNGNVSITGTPGHLDNGSVLSTTAAATPLTMTGGPSISGDFAYSNPGGHNSYGNGTIAGESPSNSDFSNHVKLLSKVPDFPVVDTTVFQQSVTTWNAPPGGSVYTNVKLPPGNYSFNNLTINGILYVMQPNNIRFGGNTTINGMIVVDNTNSGTYTTNIINFAGGVTSNAMSTITSPTILAQLTTAEKALTGAFLLAPNFSVSFGGNFHTVNGTIVADQMSFSGNAQGTIQGTIVNMKDTSVSFSGNNTITVASQGTTNWPAGLYFGNHYKPASDTYAEVHP